MTGSVIITGANGSVVLHAAEHLIKSYPDYTAIFTVRDASPTDENTHELRKIIARFPGAKTAMIHKLDLTSLGSVRSFAATFEVLVRNGTFPPIVAIICNAHYWNLVEGPELTVNRNDKTFQVNYVSHAALVLRLLGSFSPDGGHVLLISSDSHWPGKNNMEIHPSSLGTDFNSLARPAELDSTGDVQGRGYQRYATSKLALTTWGYALNRYLQKATTASPHSCPVPDPEELLANG